MRSVFRHDDLHAVSFFLQRAHQLTRFVNGNTAGNAHKNRFLSRSP